MTSSSSTQRPKLTRDTSSRDSSEQDSNRSFKRARKSGGGFDLLDSPATDDADVSDINTINDPGDLDEGLISAFPSINKGDAEEPEKIAQVKYTSSLYTDAFSLALDTVLAEESHLFNETESEIFQKFRSLPYEAQHLYVRLFLRKTGAWFRVSKLSYQNHITDVPSVCDLLCSPDIGLAEKACDALDNIEDAANLLTLEELKVIAKEDQISGTSKTQIISGMKAMVATQGRLKTKNGRITFGFGQDGREEKKYIKKLLEATGPCIRLHSAPTTLFNRVHLVFYRSTEYTETSLTTLILARSSKRNFPQYIVSRTANIFTSRDILVEFEGAIKLQAKVDLILEQSGVPTQEGLYQVLDIAENIYSRWKQLVEQEREKVKTITGNDNGGVTGGDVLMERIYLRRFSPAWVYTRIIHKGLHCLGRFKKYVREHELLTELLSQKFYHTARRGTWYQRKALIEERYYTSLPDPPPGTSISLATPFSFTEKERKRHWLRTAHTTCCHALQDPLTHIIHHHDLQKRLKKLEHHLKIPKRSQHDFTHNTLLRPTTTLTITGVRLSVPTSGRRILWAHPHPESPFTPPDIIASGSTCSVEEMCLSHYRQQGWKGMHCEGQILRTLFAYLFYDILFLYAPNVFETEYQTCPLDLFTDAFYPTRASEINHRVVEIENGKGRDIVEDVWRREGERKPVVVGLDWELPKEDVLEIMECFGGTGLARVCRVLCEDYQQRCRGIPDLFLWHKERREVMFVEVKSENDRLSDAQRLWIHVLSSAGIKTELCLAVAKKDEDEEP